MKKNSTRLAFFLISLIASSHCQIYKVPCEIQATLAYQWTSQTGLFLCSIVFAALPPLEVPEPPGAALATGIAALGTIRYLWPIISGETTDCFAYFLKQTSSKMDVLARQQIDNLTLSEITQWFAGHEGTAKKIHDWVSIIANETQSEAEKRDASLEFLKELKYLYFSANEMRNWFIESPSTAGPAAYVLIRELALLQLGISAEIIANTYTSPIARRKFLTDYRSDVEFYFKQGHLAVERLVTCLPSRDIGHARNELLAHLDPLFQTSTKLLNNDSAATYTRDAAYKPIGNGDFVGFRLDNATLFGSHAVNGTNPCRRCGWPLFSELDKNTWHSCGDAIYEISKTTNLEKPETIVTCDIVTLAAVGQGDQPSGDKLSSMYRIGGFNEATNKPLECGVHILDRDHILLTPSGKENNEKLATLDAVIIRA